MSGLNIQKCVIKYTTKGFRISLYVRDHDVNLLAGKVQQVMSTSKNGPSNTNLNLAEWQIQIMEIKF